jgi:DNA repair protein RecO (recombination protein O)
MLDACARCGTSAEEGRDFAAFDLDDGGVLCVECAHLGGRRVRADSLAVVEAIVSGGLRGVLDAPPGDDVLRDVERLAVAAIEHHSERRLRSAALL